MITRTVAYLWVAPGALRSSHTSHICGRTVRGARARSPSRRCASWRLDWCAPAPQGTYLSPPQVKVLVGLVVGWDTTICFTTSLESR